MNKPTDMLKDIRIKPIDVDETVRLAERINKSTDIEALRKEFDSFGRLLSNASADEFKFVESGIWNWITENFSPKSGKTEEIKPDVTKVEEIKGGDTDKVVYTVLKWILDHGHGGGNWRRLVEQKIGVLGYLTQQSLDKGI